MNNDLINIIHYKNIQFRSQIMSHVSIGLVWLYFVAYQPLWVI